MPWIAVDCHLPDHPKMAVLPSDAARWGWLVALSKAKLQRQPGAFASPLHFRHVMGRHGRFLDAYLKAGLLDKDGDRLVVHDWQNHQWAAAKARQREDKSETPEGQNEDIDETPQGLVRASRAVAVPVDVSVLEETVDVGTNSAREDASRLIRLVEELTGRPLTGMKPIETLGADLRDHGLERMAATYRTTRAENAQPMDGPGLIYAAHKRLYPIPDAPRLTSVERKEQERAEVVARAKEKAHALRN